MTVNVTSADIVVHATASTPVPVVSVNVRYALKITFGVNQVIWIPSHDDVIPLLPNGASYTVSARIAEGAMPDISRNAGFSSGKATISTPSYRIVDIDDELSDLIANKNVNQVGSYNAPISEYEFDVDDDAFAEKMPKYTGVIQNHSKPFNTIKLETADVNLKLDAEVMDPKIWRLKSGISDEQPTIPTTLDPAELPDNQFLFQHSDQYLAHIGQRVGYVRITDTGEVFSYTAFVDVGGVSTFTGVERHVLGSPKSSAAVPDDTPAGQGPELMEWILLDETATTMIRGMITGFMEDRPMPAHWSANEPADTVDDTVLSAHSDKFRLQFQNYGKTECRSFYETEILSPMRAVMVTDGWGHLIWTPRVLPVDENAGEDVLDETNCVVTNEIELRHIMSEIYPSVQLNTDWNPFVEKFLSPVIYQDQESAAHNNLSIDKSKEYSFKGIHAGIHTDPQIRRLAATFGDDHFYETLSLTIESYINDIALGSLVTVKFDNVRDDAIGAGNSGPLQRTMMVVEANEKRSTRTTAYELSGSMYVQSNRQAGNALHNIPVEEYWRGKINLATLPGISIVNGIAAGTVTLRSGAEYYYVDAGQTGEGLEFSASLTVTIGGTGPSVKLFVFGPFINRTTIDMTGRSHHRVGTGGTSTTSGTPGESGYVLSSRSTGAINTEALYGQSLSSDEPYYPLKGFKVYSGIRGNFTRGKNARAPDVVLDINDGVLGGVPNDLSGSAGPGSHASRHYDPGLRPNFGGVGSQANAPQTRWLDGGDGGQGGGGLVICSWGGGNQSGGTIILSGQQANPAIDQLNINMATIKGSRGGGGGPGSLLWIVDGGSHSRPTIGPSNVLAYHGDSVVSGTPIWPGKSAGSGSTDTFRSHITGTPRSNQWEAVTRIVYTPFVGAIQSRSGNVIDQFFENQRDGRVELIVQQYRPSNANIGDMWITTEQMESGSTRPNAEVLDNNGWRRLDWETDNRVYEFLLFARREYGGNTVYFGNTRPTDFDDGDLWRDPNQDVTWILHSGGLDEILTRSGVQVGDERLVDPNFVLTATAGAPYTWHYYITSDQGVMPVLTVAAKGVDSSGATLPQPYNLRALVYGQTQIELFWDRPSDLADIEKFELFLNSAPSDETADNTVTSYLFDGLIAGTSYTVGVRSINGAEYSLTDSLTVVTDGDATPGTASIVSVTVSGGFMIGAAPVGGGTDPLMTLVSAGPTIQITTENIEDTRGVFISFSGGFTTTIPVSGSAMSYTPGTPSNYAGQQFSLYVENEAGLSHSLSEINYISS